MEPIQLLLCVGAERGSWVRVGPGQGIRAVPDSRSPVKQAAGLKKREKTSDFIIFHFQDWRFSNSDWTSGPPQAWEDAEETLNLQPDGSTLPSLSADEMPSAEEDEEEEEEGILSIEHEGFELLNSTYNKITGPGRPGLVRSSPRVTASSRESVSLSSLSPELGRGAPAPDGALSPQGLQPNCSEQPRRSTPPTPSRRTSPRGSSRVLRVPSAASHPPNPAVPARPLSPSCPHRHIRRLHPKVPRGWGWLQVTRSSLPPPWGTPSHRRHAGSGLA